MTVRLDIPPPPPSQPRPVPVPPRLEVRESFDGVVAIRSDRGGCLRRPWSVVYVPPGFRLAHVLQALRDDQVAGWVPLVQEGTSS
ncbi:hypothetical protein [Amycolatopsis keratiniphila]|uniref:Uncharacterized protein n=1 Tax=Amycolatopsis keratiniphila subsp. keratiniphila TaxID=227715 RepID=A0A1W2LHD0_9PSEU|nr:hypothetical protein [Amycolatopsis keratiniphila]ONF62268.1 hypothetical protein AVR91_0238555 [Amycolatopsis keratiniphila subsp. keratiniphila]